MQTPSRTRTIVTIGRVCLGICVIGLMVGKKFVSLFFPQQVGGGLTRELLFVLVPLWSLGGIGLLLLLVAWIAEPRGAPRLRLPWPRRSDGTYFGPLVRILGVAVCSLLMLSMVALCFNDKDPTPLATRLIVGYVVGCVGGFVIYLGIIYRESRDVATTTYLNLFTPLFAFLLAPLTWPLLIVFNFRRSDRSRGNDPRRMRNDPRRMRNDPG